MARIWNLITGSNGGRPPCDVRIDERRVEFRPERPEIHRDPKGLELVAEVAYPLPPIIDIKKTRLAAQRIISPPPTPMESEMLKLGQVLRTVQVPTGAQHDQARRRMSLRGHPLRNQRKAKFAVSCHCRHCHYVSGGAPAHAVIMRSEDLIITKGAAKEHWTLSEKGNRIARLFCDQCGTPLFAKNETHPEFLPVKVGSLDDPKIFQAASQHLDQVCSALALSRRCYSSVRARSRDGSDGIVRGCQIINRKARTNARFALQTERTSTDSNDRLGWCATSAPHRAGILSR
jgi:hypothetical protein